MNPWQFVGHFMFVQECRLSILLCRTVPFCDFKKKNLLVLVAAILTYGVDICYCRGCSLLMLSAQLVNLLPCVCHLCFVHFPCNLACVMYVYIQSNCCLAICDM